MKFEKLYGRSPFFLSYCSFTAHHAKGNRHAICKWPRSNMEGPPWTFSPLSALRTCYDGLSKRQQAPRQNWLRQSASQRGPCISWST